MGSPIDLDYYERYDKYNLLVRVKVRVNIGQLLLASCSSNMNMRMSSLLDPYVKFSLGFVLNVEKWVMEPQCIKPHSSQRRTKLRIELRNLIIEVSFY